MYNLTRRLSDTYLDLDLLDQHARSILGMIRADEIVIQYHRTPPKIFRRKISHPALPNRKPVISRAP